MPRLEAVVVNDCPTLGLPPHAPQSGLAPIGARYRNSRPSARRGTGVVTLVLDELGTPPISTDYAAPIIAQRPENWRLVYAVPGGGTEVYERVR